MKEFQSPQPWLALLGKHNLSNSGPSARLKGCSPKGKDSGPKSELALYHRKWEPSDFPRNLFSLQMATDRQLQRKTMCRFRPLLLDVYSNPEEK